MKADVEAAGWRREVGTGALRGIGIAVWFSRLYLLVLPPPASSLRPALLPVISSLERLTE